MDSTAVLAEIRQKTEQLASLLPNEGRSAVTELPLKSFAAAVVGLSSLLVQHYPREEEHAILEQLHADRFVPQLRDVYHAGLATLEAHYALLFA